MTTDSICVVGIVSYIDIESYTNNTNKEVISTMSNKMKTVQVAKTKVDPRELVNIDIGVEVLQKKKIIIIIKQQ